MLLQGREQGVIAEVRDPGTESRALNVAGGCRCPAVQAAFYQPSAQYYFIDVISGDFRLEGAVGHFVYGFTQDAVGLKGQVGEQH